MPDADKVKMVADYPTPTNVSELRSFLGLAGYYRRFIKGFAQLAAPCNKLLQKGTPYTWGPEQTDAFSQLKARLTEAPILAFPQLDREFILQSDASNHAIGFILSQKDAEGREHPICYWGRSLSSAEKNYGITEKEVLAIIEGVRHFRMYLSHRPFTIVTDHAAALFMNNIKTSAQNGRLCRWALTLQGYSFKVVHKPGRVHNNADALSRRPYPPNDVTPTHDPGR